MSALNGVNEAVERVARDSYGRLVAFLAVRAGDLALAEDALGEAFLAALRAWPANGVPEKPEAWLLTVAQRRLIDGVRREITMQRLLPQFLEAAAAAEARADEPEPFPDDRLKLLLICAHPALTAGIRVPLMLQAVLGLDAARIGAAFLVPPATMGQRLSRAKTKIRDAKISFEMPEPEEWPGRLDTVLEALYAAYGCGWDEAAGPAGGAPALKETGIGAATTGSGSRRGDGLAADIAELVRLLGLLVPAEPEALGLLALVLHCQARRPARFNPAGAYVPLLEQETTRWSEPLMDEAEDALRRAFKLGRPGRFQLEAAIQSAHAARRLTGTTNWEAIAVLYEGLVRVAPGTGALVGRAAALAECYGPERGLAELKQMPAAVATNYQAYWALKAHLLARLGQNRAAQAAYDRAIELCRDLTVREFLMRRRAEVGR